MGAFGPPAAGSRLKCALALQQAPEASRHEAEPGSSEAHAQSGENIEPARPASGSGPGTLGPAPTGPDTGNGPDSGR